MFAGVLFRELKRIRRRIDDAHIDPPGFVLKGTPVSSGNSHHVSEGREDHIAVFGDCKAVVDSAHR